MYFDPSVMVWDSDIESTANSHQRLGMSNCRPMGQHPWDYGTQAQPSTMVKQPSYPSGDQLSYRPDGRVHQDRGCLHAFSGNQTTEFSVDDPRVPIAHPPPNRENSARHNASESSNIRSSRRADHAPLWNRST
ncbi:hypothetical protein AMTR_s00144p00030800 [Amborella trichopoda]|uniref:Uncharacterized protein n=1 Tax=Amborella trichopoda TaxID=13333 RepID=W1P9H9_AMBTC|nr:hypothetical protein AMTR_s00144p00030800 [Amborella trichopoda]